MYPSQPCLAVSSLLDASLQSTVIVAYRKQQKSKAGLPLGVHATLQCPSSFIKSGDVKEQLQLWSMAV